MKKIVIPATIDLSDESLLRWHFTNIAEEMGYSRRDAELLFRNNYAQIVRALRNADTREDQLRTIVVFLEEL